MKCKFVFGILISVLFIQILGCKKKKENTSSNTNTSSTPIPSCDNKCYARFNFTGNYTDTSCSNLIMNDTNVMLTADRFGANNRALLFHDGSISNLFIPGNSNTRPSLPFSVSFWVNIQDTTKSIDLVGSLCKSAINMTGYKITYDSQGLLAMMAVGGQFNSIHTYNCPIRRNSWNFVVVSFTSDVSNGNISMTVNGIYPNSGYYFGSNGSGITNLTYDPNDTLYIGNYHQNASTTSAYIDKVKIWKHALTSQEIYNEYNSNN